MNYFNKIYTREGFTDPSQVWEYIVDAYVKHDSYSNFIRHIVKLDVKERSLVGEYLVMNKRSCSKHKMKLMIMALIDCPTKID